MSYQDRKDEVWGKADKVRGKDSSLYRKDKEGNEIYYPSYGKDTDKGWQIDHSKPQAKGGTDHLNNLQVLQTKANQKKSDKY